MEPEKLQWRPWSGYCLIQQLRLHNTPPLQPLSTPIQSSSVTFFFNPNFTVGPRWDQLSREKRSYTHPRLWWGNQTNTVAIGESMRSLLRPHLLKSQPSLYLHVYMVRLKRNLLGPFRTFSDLFEQSKNTAYEYGKPKRAGCVYSQTLWNPLLSWFLPSSSL